MIKVDISTALFIYLFFSVVCIFILWMFVDFGTKMKTFNEEEKYVWHCNICDNNYIDTSSAEMSKCPRCGSYIENVSIADIKKRGKNDN